MISIDLVEDELKPSKKLVGEIKRDEHTDMSKLMIPE